MLQNIPAMFQRYRQVLPLVVVAAFCISTIVAAISGTVTIDGADYEFTLSPAHYSAFAAMGITLLSFFFLRKYYTYFLALTFLLGFLGLASFTAAHTTWSLGFGSIQISISPVLLLAGFTAYLLNHQRVNAYLFAILKPSEEKIARIRREEIAVFREKFSPKSTEELSRIVTENKLIPSAVTAARQLLQERQ